MIVRQNLAFWAKKKSWASFLKNDGQQDNWFWVTRAQLIIFGLKEKMLKLFCGSIKQIFNGNLLEQ